jgi:hypothetical protein
VHRSRLLTWSLVGVALLLAATVVGHVFEAPKEQRQLRPNSSPSDEDASVDRFSDEDASVDRLPSEDASPFDRFLFEDADIARWRTTMQGAGPFYSDGDADHGGGRSPGDGVRAEQLTQEFLDDPEASHRQPPDLPLEAGSDWSNDLRYTRPMHAAWVLLTQPDRRDSGRLEEELTGLLLDHARDPGWDFADERSYPVDFPGSAQNPIFELAQWFSQQIKTRDLLGRGAFSSAENATFDRWLYGYANWTAHWLHLEVYGRHLPGRLDRDYTEVADDWDELGDSQAYDDSPPISRAARAYTNRHAAVASAMSLAANYLAHYDYEEELESPPAYGVYTITELLEHSRLFVEETLRFSVYPEGFQGDFGRSEGRSTSTGWLYSANVLANLLEIATYHAHRGDMSVWGYATVEGFSGSAGVPQAGDFPAKNLHFFTWAMVRYVNDGWERRLEGEPLVTEEVFHDVIPAAVAARFAPDDATLDAAWRREGLGFTAYPEDPPSQGPFPPYLGEGAKSIGLIEHGGATSFGDP